MNWQPLKTFFKRLGIWVGVLVGVILVFALMGAVTLGALEWEARRPTAEHRKNALAEALAWGGLAPLPVDAEAVELKLQGHALARRYQLSFEAEPEALRAWLKACPGISPWPPTKKPSADLELRGHGEDGHNALLRWHEKRHRITLIAAER